MAGESKVAWWGWEDGQMHEWHFVCMEEEGQGS